MSSLISPLPEFVIAALNNRNNHKPKNLIWLLEVLQNYHDSSGCMLWPFGKNENGYGVVGVLRRMYLVHRLAYILTRDQNLAKDLSAMHVCDNPPCFNPSHLRAGTHKDNSYDAVSKGRMARGVRLPNSLLKPENIPEIRNLLSQGYFQRDIANRFGVSRSAIENIACGHSWRWVP